ncbi:P-loop containing nucleoside triphosphate hydrolase protein [Pelagophyceae sp. CCMP2097]|nr:P-loop containing nucleoside triphosphate hydrolase protein [Pelagophyceae sp. CCMP2097]
MKRPRAPVMSPAAEVQSKARRAPAVADAGAAALPIFAAREEILAAVREHSCVLLVGETGSGKSTQVVQFLLGAGSVSSRRGGRCCITQPRRVAVLTVCQRVAAELGCVVGSTVGYAMRFERQTSAATAVKFATDGYLIREAMDDRAFANYSVLIIDEAHERSLQTDVLCGLVRRAVLQRRGTQRPLKVVVMSATLDVESFAAFFRGCGAGDEPPAVVRVPGRLHPVDVFYCAEAQEDYMDAAVVCCAQLHEDANCAGDVLVFMPGQEEILAFSAMLAAALAAGGASPAAFTIVPLYASMPREAQLLAFAPPDAAVRKFVVATTIAETSVTIAGVRHVVDAGLVKARHFAANTGFESLQLAATSRAQAKQRAGRAGREAPGRCYRLYPEATWFSLPQTTPPEILRAELSSVVLQLMVLGVARPQDFDYISKPPAQALLRALEVLYALELVDAKGGLTARGRGVAQLPLSPLFANMVLLSREDEIFADARGAILSAVALLTAAENGVFVAPSSSARADRRADFARARAAMADAAGDVLTELRAFEDYLGRGNASDRDWCRERFVSASAMKTAAKVRQQICALVKHSDDGGELDVEQKAARREATIMCLVAGLGGLHAARRDASRKCYRTFRGNHDVYIHPSSVLHGKNPPPPTVVFTASILTNRQYVRGLTSFDASLLPKLNPQLFVAGDLRQERAAK